MRQEWEEEQKMFGIWFYLFFFFVFLVLPEATLQKTSVSRKKIVEAVSVYLCFCIFVFAHKTLGNILFFRYTTTTFLKNIAHVWSTLHGEKNSIGREFTRGGRGRAICL